MSAGRRTVLPSIVDIYTRMKENRITTLDAHVSVLDALGGPGLVVPGYGILRKRDLQNVMNVLPGAAQGGVALFDGEGLLIASRVQRGTILLGTLPKQVTV